MARGHEAVSIEGVRQLRASLRKAGHDLADLKRAHGEAGNIASERAVHEAPARPGSHLLASSVRFSATKTGVTLRAGNNKDVPYAGPIHWGWPARGIRAQPFLSDAAVLTEPRWLPIYEQAVEAALQKVKGI